MSIEKFSFPTPIHFGVGSRKLVGSHLKNLGFKRPLIVTDKAMADLPLMAEFISHLDGLEVSVYAGVHGNPTASQVTAGGAAFKAHKAELLEKIVKLRQKHGTLVQLRRVDLGVDRVE